MKRLKRLRRVRTLVLRGALALLSAFAAFLPLLVAPASTVRAAAQLTIAPITWNIIGLDSNTPATGPSSFPVGVRVCNTGDATATNVVASFVWDSVNSYLSIDGLTSITEATLASGACVDFYYLVAVQKVAAAFDTSRQYHITVTATGGLSASTPANREIYVEHLVSQNRNTVEAITGPASVYVGSTYEYVLDSKTATGGYEQLESFLTFPSSMFRVLHVQSTYAQPAAPNNTNDKEYADACGWDNDLTRAATT